MPYAVAALRGGAPANTRVWQDNFPAFVPDPGHRAPRCTLPWNRHLAALLPSARECTALRPLCGHASLRSPRYRYFDATPRGRGGPVSPSVLSGDADGRSEARTKRRRKGCRPPLPPRPRPKSGSFVRPWTRPVLSLILPGVLLIALDDGGVAEWLKAAVC